MVPIELIQSKLKLIKKNREKIRNKFSKLESDLKEAFNEMPLFNGQSNSITLEYIDNSYVDKYSLEWVIYGYLHFYKRELNVFYKSLDRSDPSSMEDCVYKSKHILECSDDWLDELSQEKVINSLLSTIDNNVQYMLETSDDSMKRLESTLQSQSNQLGKSCQEELIQMKESDLLKDWSLARDRIESDPAESVTRSSSYIESVCRKILKEQQKQLPEKKTITSLINECLKILKLTNDEAERDVKQVIGGIKGITQGIGALPSHFGTAHGKSPNDFEIDSHYARLANDSAATVSVFLLYRHKSKLAKAAR